MCKKISVLTILIFSLCFSQVCFAKSIEQTLPENSTIVSTESKNYNLDDLKTQTFETKNLILTPTNVEDLEYIFEILLKGDIKNYNNFFDTCETKKEALNCLKDKFEFSKAIDFTITLKSNKQIIGRIRLLTAMHDTGRLTANYMIGKEFQGKGYESESAFVLLNKAFNADDINEIYFVCNCEDEKFLKFSIDVLDYIEGHDMSFTRTQEEYSGSVKVNTTIKEYFHFFDLHINK